MARKSNIVFDPNLSIKDNAAKNNVSVAGIYYYLRTNNLDRNQDRATEIVKEIKSVLHKDPTMSQAKVAKELGRSVTTINKYWKVATGEKHLVPTREIRAKEKANKQELEIIGNVSPRVVDDLIKAESFSDDILTAFEASRLIEDGGSINGHTLVAASEKKIDIVGCPTILDFTLENLKYLLKNCQSKVALLLPLSILSNTEKYAKVFKKYAPSRVYAYTSNIGKDGANVEGYAWYVWDKSNDAPTELKWMQTEAKSESKRQKESVIEPIVQNNKCLLFDFDNTLFNSDSRRGKNGHFLRTYSDSCIEGYKLYDGWKEVFSWANENNVKTAIVSKTPKDHIQKALDHFGLKVDAIYGKKRKSSGSVLLKAISEMEGTISDSLYVGDHRDDADMARMANVPFAAALWDSWHEAQLSARKCLTISSPTEIIPLFDKLSSIPTPIEVDESCEPETSMPSTRKSIVEESPLEVIPTPSQNVDYVEPTPVVVEGKKIYGIIGAVIGDIVGSRFEFGEDKYPKKYNFKLFGTENLFTDDTIMTAAIADALLHGKSFRDAMLEWGHHYPNGGWGGNFRLWLKAKDPQPYGSKGNGCGMRISPVGFYGKTLDEVLQLAEEATLPTHNTEDGLNGAKSIASAIFLSRQGKSKAEIKQYIEQNFGYNLDLTKDGILDMVESFKSPLHRHKKEMAIYTVPVAIMAFLRGNSYEDVIRITMTYGGDTDTIGAMSGAMAAAYHGVPLEIANEAVKYLSQDILAILNEFDKTSFVSPRITPPKTNELNSDCILVYGRNIEEKGKGEDGSFDVERGYNGHRQEGYPIRTIGATLDETKQDVENFIKHATEHPEKTFFVKKVGLGGSHIGLETIARLFEPARDKGNIFLPKAYIDYYEGKKI